MTKRQEERLYSSPPRQTPSPEAFPIMAQVTFEKKESLVTGTIDKTFLIFPTH